MCVKALKVFSLDTKYRIFLASRASGCHLDTKTPKITLQDTQILGRVVLKNVIFKLIIEYISPQFKCHVRYCKEILCLISISNYMLKVAIYVYSGTE